MNKAKRSRTEMERSCSFTEGSVTVETALVMPLLLVTILSVLYLTIHVRNGCCITSSCIEQAISGRTQSGPALFFSGNIERTDEEIAAGEKEELHLSYLLDANQPETHIDILFCMATDKAVSNICSGLDNFLLKRGYNKVKYHIHVVQKLDEALSNDITGDPELMKVLEKPKYFHQNLKDDTAYKVGNVIKPYLGFDECALPVVLSHNTPNNSLPILWQDTDNNQEFKGLFPRVSRH